MFRADFGVRQGSVLSPFLFAVYLADLAKLYNRKSNVFIILYADDILLLAPSVCELDNLFKICECELNLLDMAINFKKSSLFALDIKWMMHHVLRYLHPQVVLFHGLKNRDILVFIYCSHVHLNVHYQITEKRVIARKMLYLERLVACKFAVDNLLFYSLKKI